jgi:pilus assembly protein CpaD
MMPVPLLRTGPLLLALALGACASGRHDAVSEYVGLTPTEQYAIQVRQQPEEIRLAPHPAGLTMPQEAALADLASRWRAGGGGMITIQAPSNADAGATVEASRGVLITLGAAPEEVRVVSYQPPQGAPAAVIVGYAAFQALGPQCGQDWEDLSTDRSNRTFRNFGCAVTANVAAQIGNPRDLVRPRAMGPADATRRSVVLDKYRKGEITSTAKDPQSDATLSEATKD